MNNNQCSSYNHKYHNYHNYLRYYHISSILRLVGEYLMQEGVEQYLLVIGKLLIKI